jgi:two-component system, NtrC family, sensor histidine kinase HydH
MSTVPHAEATPLDPVPRWRVYLQDAAWLALFGGLAAASTTRNDAEMELLTALAAFQILEPRWRRLHTPRGAWLSVFIKLLLSYLLIGVTDSINSSYYLILLVPIVSAATLLGAWSTILVYLIAIGSYLSFLLFLDWDRYFLPPSQVQELALRALLLAMVAFLTHTLVDTSRRQARRYQATAEELAAANRSLHAAEAAVRRSERLAALGQLTAGLAHELRNPLGTMKASAELLQRNVPADPPIARELSGYIAEEVDRLNSLITRFLDFSRPLQLHLELSSLDPVLDHAVAELERHQPPFDVTVYKNYSTGVRPFLLDAVMLERVVYNLLLNAAQASPAQGVITLKTRAVEDTVEIAVIDRGTGIAREHMENIFNPFFTTKPSGSGLGLGIVSRIVDEHGGRIAVESTLGEGSVFRVLLPARMEPEPLHEAGAD